MLQKIEQYVLKDKINYIKIHGLQRSGTNYISFLINNNFIDTECLINVGGWKHGHYCAPWSLGQEVHVVLVVKNPYAWLVSIYKYLKPSLSFGNFIKRPLVWGEPSGSPYLLRSCNPIQYWNDMNFHWMSVKMNNKKLCIIPYESVLRNVELSLKNISSYFDIPLNKPTLDSKNKMLAGNEKPEAFDEKFDSSYYTDQKYISFFDNDIFNFVNQQIEPMIMQQVGYKWEGK